jgi:hypothetical protein
MPLMPPRAGTARFRNGSPWFLWIFMAVWMTGLGLFTYILVRDGPPRGYTWTTMGLLLAAGWLGGLGATRWAASQRVLCVDVDAIGGLDIMWYGPFRVVRRRVEARQVRPAVVVATTDSDGDPYFVCRVTLGDGTELDLSEGHDRPTIEREVERFNNRRRR